MPKAFSTPSLVALNITSQELGRGGGAFLPPLPTKIVLMFLSCRNDFNTFHPVSHKKFPTFENS